MANIEKLEDDGIHQFAIVGGKLVIQSNFKKHFINLNDGIKHGYLVVDKGKLVNEGSNFSGGELDNFYDEVIII